MLLKSIYNCLYYSSQNRELFTVICTLGSSKKNKEILNYIFFYIYSNAILLKYLTDKEDENKVKYFKDPFLLGNAISNNVVFLNFDIQLKNNYFFWHFFSNDYLIRSFLNVIMNSGKKYNTYNIIYKSFYFIKKLIGIQPILLLKKFLYKYRFLFNIHYITLKYKVITLPKLLSVKSQINRSIKYILNTLKFKSLKIKSNNKHISFYKRISYLVLNFFLNNFVFKKTIQRQREQLLRNKYVFFKEEHKNKYITNDEINSKKPRLFKMRKTKFRQRSINKSYKIKNNRIKYLNTPFLIKNDFLITNHQIHILSKKKIKSKWI